MISEVFRKGRDAKEASYVLAAASTAEKNQALAAIADGLVAHEADILAANAVDLQRAKAKGMAPAMVDRLTLTKERIAAMAEGVRQVIALPDPAGVVLDEWDRPNGLHIRKVSVPLGVIAIIYSYSGGLKAVLYTDFIQGMVLIFGIALTLVVMIGDIHGGFGTIMDTLTTGHKFMFQNEVWMSPDILSTSVFIVFIGGGLATFASYVSSQDIVQRFTTTTDIKQLNKMTLGNGALSIFAATVFYLVGTSLYVFYQQNPDLLMTSRQDLVFATYITYELPAGITGILLAAIYAASQSTLSTGINSVATSWVLDIQSVLNPDLDSQKQTRIAKLVSLGIGILSIIVAMIMAVSDIHSAYEWFNSFIGLALGSLAGMFVLGAFSKRANAKGAFVGFICSTAVVMYLKYFVPSVSFWSYTAITIILSLVAGTIVSRLTNKDYTAPEGTTAD